MSSNKNNRNKKSDNLRDVILSTKNPSQADIKELFEDRTDNGMLTFKKGVGDFIKLLSKEQIEALIAAIPIPPPGGSEYTETIVNISSAQILNMGTSPIELLPAAGANTYYDIDKIVIEYTHNTTAYSGVFQYLWAYQNLDIFNVDASLIKTAEDMIYVNSAPYPLYDMDGTYNYGGVQNLVASALPLLLTTWDNTNPTLGDGTLRVKIYHKTITFGA